jgi:predicted PurR-regulated permease PerM
LFVIVGVALALYLLFQLRKPIGWIVTAIFLAVALSGPVNWLERRTKRRGPAIALVFLALLLLPVLVGAVVVPPLVTQGNNLVQDLPAYATDLREFVQKNDTLRNLNQDYSIVEQLQSQADKLPAKVGDAAGTLGDIGLGLVNSIFALITILVLTGFLLGSGREWVRKFVAMMPYDKQERVGRSMERMGKAVGGYVGGALAQALVAGVTAYIVLAILGVPFRAPLALLVALADLIPLVGATIGAVFVGIVTLFNDFPTTTIVWTIWSIIYQQLENTVIQPQIQRRAVDVHPFVVMVSVLFGATLLGVAGALVAIPVAASIQIVLNEWNDWRRDQGEELAAPAGMAAPG